MKKKIITAAFVAALGISAGYIAYSIQEPEAMSDMALANVEALAGEEGSNQKDCETYCKSDERYTCIITWGSGIKGVSCPNHRKK